MTHFLRTPDNSTVIECDVSEKDLHAATDLVVFSGYMVGLYTHDKEVGVQFLLDIDALDEIRGWWFEKEIKGDWESIDDFVAAKFKSVGKKWGLAYVTD